MTDKELWKDIEWFGGKYQISNMGNVKSLKRERKCRVNGGTIAIMTIPEKFLKKWKRSSYFLVDLWIDGKRNIKTVHELVYKTFVGEVPDGYQIHHKDENKENNCVDNLVCVSCLDHNRIHHAGKPSWNKGLKMPPEPFIKMWETRRRKQCLNQI